MIMSDNEPHVKKIKSVRDVIIESIECEPGTEGCTGDPDTCPNDPNRCDKKLSMFGYYDDTIKDSVEHVLSESLNELTKTFTASSRRWQTIVYPSMFAFILLATYGFFLISSLTKDVGSVAKDMHDIVGHMDAVSKNMIVMTQTMDVQTMTMKEMNTHVRNMGVSMSQMRYEIATMNNSVSRPMQFMNSFMPW